MNKPLSPLHIISDDDAAASPAPAESSPLEVRDDQPGLRASWCHHLPADAERQPRQPRQERQAIGMSEEAIAYALAKQVPDMERGFTISTSYGDIVIPPGLMADRLARQVRVALRVEGICLQGEVARLAQGGAA